MGGHGGKGGFFWQVTIPGPEVEGAAVPRELPAECALAVWQAARWLLQWAEAVMEGGDTGDLFDPEVLRATATELDAARFEPDLRDPTLLIVAELASGNPNPGNLARACLSLADWALSHDAARSASFFAETAARVWPESARFSWVAGRLLKEHDPAGRSEAWLLNSLQAANRSRDWEAKTHALMSLANLGLQVGDYSGAKAFNLRHCERPADTGCESGKRRRCTSSSS